LKKNNGAEIFILGSSCSTATEEL